MKKYIYRWLVGITLTTTMSQGFASTPSGSQRTHDSQTFINLDDLKAYLNTRGFVETRKRGGVLRLAGDVRAKWIHAREDIKTPPAQTDKYKPLPVNRYRSEFNLYVDYNADKTWLTSEMSWAAIAGGESSAAGMDIDRAFLGYRFYENPETRTNIFAEIGRSSLGSIFESEVQFNSNFDGIHLYATRRLCERFPYNVIIHGGPFVVNMAKKHYAWVVEGIVNKLPGNFSVKCSVIDWNSFSPTEAPSPSKTAVGPVSTTLKYKYCVWQWLVGKYSELPWFHGKKKPLYVYGAYLLNSLAKATPTTLNEKHNKAWFVGGTLGRLRKAGDWSATVRYEYVEALAVPEIDVSGIGRGNQLKYWFAQAIAGNYDPKEANGFTNYKGASYLFMYGITDSLSFRAYGAYSKPADDRLGSDFTYRKFDLGLISAF
ncbi:hypothetical protein [Chlamydia felis Fe/C-56]|uniref:Uncharacterized protein n=1 Tax=Chlamydia felis (strain Fe/C-56) TaxID=264202 RepID=Q252M4_CHLFF|nr:hypothetical protein [Chlamydia felis]BAE81764.1 hypothetical protein [Chlamydia felis Fe/C-56]